MQTVMSFCALSILLLAGKYLRVKVSFFQRLYIPSSVIGGLLGLVVITVFKDLLHPGWTAGWSKLPGLLINVVFASLFLGVAIPPLRKIFQQAGPQLAYGQIVAWGQYVVGAVMVLFLLGPLFGVDRLFGVIVPVGFEGGHGTAGGLSDTFARLGWSDGTDFGLASATAGIVSAIIVGMMLVNWAARRGIVENLRDRSKLSKEELAGIYPENSRPDAGKQTVSVDSIDSLALHLAFIGLAVFIGFGLKQGFVWLESSVFHIEEKIMRAFPLFPLCMLGGLAVQLTLSRAAKISPVDHGLMQRLSGTALDYLVAAAISTIRLSVIADGLLPLLLIVAGGIAWNVFCVMWLARRMLPDAWFERAIAEMGQSMGVTATGLLLLRVVDPESRTDASAAFGYKQLLHEPFMGGGLWTSFAVLFVYKFGLFPVLAVSMGAIAAWIAVWFLLFRKAMKG